MHACGSIKHLFFLVFTSFIFTACPSSDGETIEDSGSNQANDSGLADITNDSGSNTSGMGDNNGTLDMPIPQSGVAYVGHYYSLTDDSNKLLWYRTDGEYPTKAGEMNIDAPVQGMAIDSKNNLLAIASDSKKQISVYSVSRPANATAMITPPVKVKTFDYSELGTPVSLLFSEKSNRLYVTVSPSLDAVTYKLYSYDTSNPSQEMTLVDGWPKDIPISVYQGIDAARGLFFLTNFKENTLHVYDLDDSGLKALEGEAIPLELNFPLTNESNQNGFRARNISVDPWRHHIYIPRSQGNESELMAFTYPEGVPRNGAKYGDFVKMSDFKIIQDAFDTSIPADNRPHILDALQVEFDQITGRVFMSGKAWNGTTATGIITTMNPELGSLGEGCNDYEGFGCFTRDIFENTPSSHLQIDAALCVDATHQILFAPSVASQEENPGTALFYKYDQNGTMSHWIPESGHALSASTYPIAAVCH